MNLEEQQRKVEQITARALTDKAFKQKLLSNPATVLQSEGVEVRPGVEIRIVEDSDQVRHLVLPLQASGKELSDEQLKQVAAGAGAAHRNL